MTLDATAAALLEERLRGCPDDLAAWAAYGALLTARGDRRAKLIELELALRAGRSEARYELDVLRKELASTLGLRPEDGVTGRFFFSAFRLGSVRATARCLGRLLDCPQLEATELDIEGADPSLPELLALLARLRPTRLRFDDIGPEPERLRPLLQSPLLAEVTELCLAFEHELAAGQILPVLPALVGALSGGRLRHLGLWGCSLGDEGLRSLCQEDAVPGLETLTLAFEERLGPAAFLALAQRGPAQLRRMALFGCGVAAGALDGLAHSPLGARLLGLSLCLTDAGRAFWERFASAEALPHLRVLHLDESDFGDEQALALASGAPRVELEKLSMSFVKLSSRSAAALLRSRGLPNLHLAANCTASALSSLTSKAERQRFRQGSVHDCGTGDWIRNDCWIGRW